MLKRNKPLRFFNRVNCKLYWLRSSFFHFSDESFFVTIPDALRESAIIDGASEFVAFWKVILPLARPGIATVAIFQFVSIWNEFMYAATFILSPEKGLCNPLFVPWWDAIQPIGGFMCGYGYCSNSYLDNFYNPSSSSSKD